MSEQEQQAAALAEALRQQALAQEEATRRLVQTMAEAYERDGH
ncbi:hypothetical protein [Streptomyces sp. NPDC001502]